MLIRTHLFLHQRCNRTIDFNGLSHTYFYVILRTEKIQHQRCNKTIDFNGIIHAYLYVIPRIEKNYNAVFYYFNN